MNAPIPPNLSELIKLAKGTKYESVAGDENKLEQLLLNEMKASKDPVTREIGSGIVDGTMTWRTVATSSAYADFVNDSVEAMRQFDFGGAFDALAAEQEAARKQAEQPTGREPRSAAHEDENLFKGFKKRKSR